MIRVGIIGCGRIIEDGHAPVFAELANRFEVVAVSDTTPVRRDLIGDLLNVPANRRFAEWNDLLALEEVELVDMALPHFLHLRSLLDAAAAGKAVLMEKPMATSMAQADQMIAAVERGGRPACIIHNYLWQPINVRAREVIASGAIGEPYLYRCEHFSGDHYQGAIGYDPTWRSKAARGGGGAVIDNAYHQIYLAEAFMGSPASSVYAGVGTFVHDIDVEDLGLIQLAHTNGARSIINQGWAGGGALPVTEVHGREGVMRFERGGESPITIRRGENVEAVSLPGGSGWDYGFEGIFAEYADALESGEPPPVSFAAGYRNLQIVMAAYQSGRSGEAVRLD